MQSAGASRGPLKRIVTPRAAISHVHRTPLIPKLFVHRHLNGVVADEASTLKACDEILFVACGQLPAMRALCLVANEG